MAPWKLRTFAVVGLISGLVFHSAHGSRVMQTSNVKVDQSSAAVQPNHITLEVDAQDVGKGSSTMLLAEQEKIWWVSRRRWHSPAPAPPAPAPEAVPFYGSTSEVVTLKQGKFYIIKPYEELLRAYWGQPGTQTWDTIPGYGKDVTDQVKKYMHDYPYAPLQASPFLFGEPNGPFGEKVLMLKFKVDPPGPPEEPPSREDRGKAFIKWVKDMRKCIKRLPKKWHFIGISKFALSNMGHHHFFRKLHERYFAEGHQSWSSWIKNSIKHGILEDDLRGIDFRSSSWVDDLGNRMVHKLGHLSKSKGFEPSNCMFEYIIKPLFLDSLHNMQGALDGKIDESRDHWNSLMDNFFSFITKPIRQFFDRTLGVVKKGLDVPKGYLHRNDRFMAITKFITEYANAFCAKQQSKSIDLLNALAGGVKDRCGNVLEGTQNLNETISQLKHDLEYSDEDALIQVTTNVVSDYLVQIWTQVKERIITPQIMKAGNFLLSLASTGLHTLDALAGLIPEVGAALSSFFSAVVEWVLHFLQGLLIDGTLDLVDDAFDGVLVLVEDWVKAHLKGALDAIHFQSTVDNAESRLHHFSFLTPVVTDVIAYVLPESQKALANCSNYRFALAELADAVTAPDPGMVEGAAEDE